MAKRDPEKTARNKIIDDMTVQLNRMLPGVLSETGIRSEHSLNGIYGGKFAEYIDIKNVVIHSPVHFISLYFKGFESKLQEVPPLSAHIRNYELLKKSPQLRNYLILFLRRTYFRLYEELSKKRPRVEDAMISIGQNRANYEILITPRFNKRTGQWENDKSEIRHFPFLYWSIGHIIETGLLIPGKEKKINFSTPKQYLDFFRDVIVRNSGSEYEYRLAEMYCEYVLSVLEPKQVPLLIPEFRFEGSAVKHKYRLDFTIIDPYELTKMGFELSPWSSHSYLSKIGDLTQAEINKMALDNFEKEMGKHKDFFRKHGIFVRIYTDSNLKSLSQVFNDMKELLEPKTREGRLNFQIMNDFGLN